MRNHFPPPLHGASPSRTSLPFWLVNKGTVSTDTKQELKFNLEIFLNGDKVKTLTVASRDNRTVPLDASKEEMEKIMLQSLQGAMQRIIPEVMTLIDKK